MTTGIVIPGKRGLHVVGRAHLLDPDDKRMLDWAETHIANVNRWDIGWLLGRYIHTEHANENGHIFPLEDIKTYHKLIPFTPVNVLHNPEHIIGTYMASELLYPKGQTTAVVADNGDPTTPWVETLAALWRMVFPQDYERVKTAARKGLAFQSMESIPASITCAECSTEFTYDGPVSDTYTCGHLGERTSPKWLNKPHFVGGAVVIPPGRPGWKDASIKQVARLAEASPDEAERICGEVAAACPEKTGVDLEEAMGLLLLSAGYNMPPKKKKRSLPGNSNAAPAGDAATGGAMVAIIPPANVREAIAAWGTEPADEIHLTVAFMGGDVNELGYTAADLVAAVQAAASLTAPFEAEISGMGVFFLDDGGECTYASVDAAGLPEFRQRVIDATTTAGLEPNLEHGYTPHISAAFTSPGRGPDGMPPIETWTIDSVDVVWAHQHHTVPLLAKAPAAAS